MSINDLFILAIATSILEAQGISAIITLPLNLQVLRYPYFDGSYSRTLPNGNAFLMPVYPLGSKDHTHRKWQIDGLYGLPEISRIR